MTRKLSMAVLALLAGALLLQGFADPSLGQQKGKGRKGAGKAPYVHTVIFYLKKDVPKGTTANVIRDSHKLLGKIPSVKLLRVGRPAKQATPDYASSDYDVGLTILFENYAGLQTYLKHERHLQFVAKYEKTFEKVLVYDFSNQRQ